MGMAALERRRPRFLPTTTRELAAKEWKYVQNYADAKSAVVRDIVDRAEREAG
jgi:GrpB-like predicted nucleotidyltransferase (UPF0157 family)